MSSISPATPAGNNSSTHGDPQASTSSPGMLVIHIGDRAESLNPAMLGEPQFAEQWRRRIAGCVDRVRIDVGCLPLLSDEDRWSAIRFLSALPPGCRFTVGDESSNDLFDAILGLITVGVDPNRFSNAVRAASEAAALLYPRAVQPACSQIMSRIRAADVSGYHVAKLVHEVGQLAAGLCGSYADPELVLVVDVVDGAPCASTAIVPRAWELYANGIQRKGSDPPEETIPAALVISERLHDNETGAEFTKIAWNRGQRWQTHTAPRVTLATARTITNLAEFGFPVTSNNAADVVQYLADFEAENLDVIPLTLVTNQLGWYHLGGISGFLWGREYLSASAAQRAGDLATGQLPIEFHGSDAGDDQIASGFRAHGTFAGWQAAICPAFNHMPVLLMLYAALTAPLLSLLESPNFVVSLAGPTTRAKTSVLRMIGSLWGCPDERAPAAALGTFDATRVWIERAMALRNDHPLILDDTKRARRKEDVAQTIYDATSGRGRGRGSILGTQRSETWRTILFVSGEAPVTSFTQDGGTRARVLEVWGSPFGAVTPATSQLINNIWNGILQNYGHAGPRFVQFLLANQHQREGWRQHYEQLRRQYEQRAGVNGVAIRMASHFASISMAAILAHSAGVLPWCYSDCVSALWPQLTADTHEADRAAVALRHVMSWAQSHRNDFCRGPSGHGNQQPSHAGWAGRWDAGNNYGYVGFLEHKLVEILEEAEFESEAVRRNWRDRGWLRLSAEKNFYRARMGGNYVVSLVAITRQAIIEVMGSDDEAAPEPGG